MKLGSHNSGTGEHPLNFLTWVGLPFCRCQNKTLTEQYARGVRLFDLRVKYVRDDYYLAHGLGLFNITLDEALRRLDQCSKWNDGDTIYVMVTYEGKQTAEEEEIFVADVQESIRWTSNIVLSEIAVKLPKWRTLYKNQLKAVSYRADYVKIVGWKKLIPIPRFWWWIYPKAELTDTKQEYTMRDFI